METAKPRELNTLHVGKTRTTHGSKSHHGLRKWNSSLHHASSLKFFPHCIDPRAQELHNWRGKRYRERSHVSSHEKAFACYDSCPESEMYRTLVFLVFSLHTRTYTKCI